MSAIANLLFMQFLTANCLSSRKSQINKITYMARSSRVLCTRLCEFGCAVCIVVYAMSHRPSSYQQCNRTILGFDEKKK